MARLTETLGPLTVTCQIQLNVDVVRHTETGLLLYVGSDIYYKEKKIRLVLGMES